MIWIVCAAIWVASSVIAYGAAFAYFEGAYRELEDVTSWARRAALICCVFGPIAFISQTLTLNWRHGLKWR